MAILRVKLALRMQRGAKLRMSQQRIAMPEFSIANRLKRVEGVAGAAATRDHIEDLQDRILQVLCPQGHAPPLTSRSLTLLNVAPLR